MVFDFHVFYLIFYILYYFILQFPILYYFILQFSILWLFLFNFIFSFFIPVFFYKYSARIPDSSLEERILEEKISDSMKK